MGIKNAKAVEGTQAVENAATETVTVNVVTPTKERAAAVSGDTFVAFIYSPEAREMTPSQAAEHLGMNKLTFAQRLNTLRVERKEYIAKLIAAGKQAEAEAVPEIPKLKDGRVGRTGPRQELSAGMRALMSFVAAK